MNNYPAGVHDSDFDLPSIEERSEPVRCGECGNWVFEDEPCLKCAAIDALPKLHPELKSLRENEIEELECSLSA